MNVQKFVVDLDEFKVAKKFITHQFISYICTGDIFLLAVITYLRCRTTTVE